MTKSPSPHPLLDCLEQSAYDRLRKVGTVLNLRLRGKDRNQKAAWIGAIHGCWTDPHARSRQWAKLTPAAQGAFARLCRAGSVPASIFLQQFGSIRPLAQLRSPFSPAEELWLAALLFTPQGEPLSTATRLIPPGDLCPPLSRTTHPRAPAFAGEEHPPSIAPPAILHDLAQWLIILRRPETHLRHGRWLSPTDAARLRRHCQHEAAHPSSLSTEPHAHSQDPYLRNLAFWSVCAGLVDGTRLLPAAWTWLEQPPAAQLNKIWQCWRMDDSQALAHARHRYQQPDAPWTAEVRARFLHYLKTLNKPFTPRELADKMLGDPQLSNAFFSAHYASLDDFDAVIAQLLATSLMDLGIVALVENPTAPEDDLHYRLTPTGHWLLDPSSQEDPFPAWRWSSEASLTVVEEGEGRNAWRIEIPWDAPLLGQVRLADYADREWGAFGTTERGLSPTPKVSAQYFGAKETEFLISQTGKPAVRQKNSVSPQVIEQIPPKHRYRLHQGSVARAAANGLGLPDLHAAFRLLGLPLTPEKMAELDGWWREGRWLQLTFLPILRTQTREQLQQVVRLTDRMGIIGEILSPTVAVWRGPLNGTLARLRAAGLHPASSLPVGEPPSESAADSLQDPGSLWLAGRIQQLLGEYAPLSPQPSTQDLDALFGRLPPVQQAALQAQLEQAQMQLMDLLDNLPFAPPPTPSDPEPWARLIQGAIEAKQDLEIVYFSPGRNLPVRRRIEPYWLEEHHGVSYVRAYCHLAGRVLTFRLDRIREMAAAPALSS